jgi:hypothetical protein
VGWFLQLKNVQHHGDKAVNRICVLAGSVFEVVWAQSVKGAKCQRVSVNK